MSWRAVPPLIAVNALLMIASPVSALDAGSLKLIVAELPYPQMQFGLSVGLSGSDALLMTPADPRELLADADRRLAAKADDPQACFDRGRAREMLRDPGAEEDYRRAVELWRPIAGAEPDNVQARLGLARALVPMGDWPTAQPLAQELAAQHPELWWPHFALAQHVAGALFGLLGTGFLGSIEPPDFDDPQAVAEWGKPFPAERVPAMLEALRRAPEDPSALDVPAQQLAAEALAHLTRAQQAAPEEIAPPVLAFLIHWQLGMLQSREAGSYDAAHEELFALAEAHPEIIRLRLFANFQRVLGAMVRGRAGGFLSVWHRFSAEDQAQLAADEAATRQMLKSEAGRTPDAYELAGVYSLLHGDLDGALATLRESTEQDPTSGERWEAYVGVLTQQNDLPAVQTAVEQALRHADNGTLRCALAKVHQKRG
ncbi:MAG: hypothetical protein FJX74_14255, partial [Armatimonadetes bacterium]|nr:hypothetical protein [Armatimonadota bacterium]